MGLYNYAFNVYYYGTSSECGVLRLRANVNWVLKVWEWDLHLGSGHCALGICYRMIYYLRPGVLGMAHCALGIGYWLLTISYWLFLGMHCALGIGYGYWALEYWVLAIVVHWVLNGLLGQ